MAIQDFVYQHVANKNVRGNIYGQNRTQQQYGKAKDHDQKAVTKGVNIQKKPQREGSAAELRNKWNLDPNNHECFVKSGIMSQTDPTYHRTNAEREALRDGWRITDINKSGRAADVNQSNEYS